MAKYHMHSTWLAVQIRFQLRVYFKCKSEWDGRGQEADPRITCVTVCGEKSDEGELFYSALSRNKDEGMSGTTNGPRFGVP
jgi:hypothetical protein